MKPRTGALLVVFALAALSVVALRSGPDDPDPEAARVEPEPAEALDSAAPTATPSSTPEDRTEARRLAAMQQQADALDALRERIEADPNDIEARASLVSELFAHRDDASRAERRRHILWMLEHAPGHALLGTPLGWFMKGESPADYAEAVRLLGGHIEAADPDPAVLANAAGFFVIGDRRDMAFTALFRLEALQPDESRWPAKLAHGLMLDYDPALDDPDNQERAAESLSAYQRAIDRADDAATLQDLVAEAAGAAAKAGELDLAERYALSALRAEDTSPAVGHTLHGAHQALGLVHLGRGDFDAAAAELLAMARVTPSAPMRSFGPSMMLADRLLAAGRSADVLAYLEACGAFWPKPELLTWVAAVEVGQRPGFGANLRY